MWNCKIFGMYFGKMNRKTQMNRAHKFNTHNNNTNNANENAMNELNVMHGGGCYGYLRSCRYVPSCNHGARQTTTQLQQDTPLTKAKHKTKQKILRLPWRWKSSVKTCNRVNQFDMLIPLITFLLVVENNKKVFGNIHRIRMYNMCMIANANIAAASKCVRPFSLFILFFFPCLVPTFTSTIKAINYKTAPHSHYI